MKRNKIVLIEWNDTAVVHGWQCAADMVDIGMANCTTVGFLLSESNDAITLCSSKSDQGLIMEKVVIPKGCIKSIKELRVR